MTPRLVCAVLVVFLLMQSGLLAPAAMTFGMAQSMADCAGQYGMTDDDCPCCPQGVSMHAGCGTICLGTFAGVIVPIGIAHETAVRLEPSLRASGLASQIYAPANPPPIS